ncbi:4Fe-4S dicluster domain-containing protein, partial [Chloroflexota bacterium]
LPVNERVTNFNEITATFEDEQIMAEAKRCFCCGKCFGCDACFSYCSEGAIKRAHDVSVQKYEFALDLCTGCKKCAEECPCGYVDMV